ncbi:MAG: DNA cytosine methyltransferase [Thermoplasmatales archaeon]
MELSKSDGKYKVASLFAGIGGICLAFKNSGAQIVWANEIDHDACVTYRSNFGDSYLVEGDIRGISPVPDFDILTAGFPCQAFSIAGYQKGFTDPRGNIFFEVVRILQEKKPRAIFLENVKNLQSHDGGNTFKIIREALRQEGYYLSYKVMNSMCYGNIPQNRERIYIVGFREKFDLSNFHFPDPVKLTKTIHDIVDITEKVDEKYYYRNNSQYYSIMASSVKRMDTVYQLRRVYMRENKSGVCPTLTANMGSGGHNVPIILDRFGIRKLTPRETFRFQGFPDSFILPDSLSNSALYHQAGNSVVVPVVERIAHRVIQAISETDKNSRSFVEDSKENSTLKFPSIELE